MHLSFFRYGFAQAQRIASSVDAVPPTRPFAEASGLRRGLTMVSASSTIIRCGNVRGRLFVEIPSSLERAEGGIADFTFGKVLRGTSGSPRNFLSMFFKKDDKPLIFLDLIVSIIKYYLRNDKYHIYRVTLQRPYLF